MESGAFISIVIAGFVGTTVMTLVMRLIHGLKWAEADMIRAIGTIYTKNSENAFLIGVFVHYLAGTCFAFLYAIVLALSPIPSDSRWIIPLLMLFTGLFHGLIMSMGLVVFVAEHHPLERFRRAGLGVVLAHLVGHLFYGFSVGVVFMITGVRLTMI